MFLFLVLPAWILAEGFRLLGWDTDLTGSGSAERCVLRGELPGDGPHLLKVLSKSLAMVWAGGSGVFLQAVILGPVMYYAEPSSSPGRFGSGGPAWRM